MIGHTVDFGWAEMQTAAIVGTQRNVRRLYERANHRAGLDRDDPQGWANHIVGAIGELVVCKALDRWPNLRTAPNDRESGDVAGYEVRATAHPTGRLIIRPSEKDAIYVLVHVTPPHHVIAGWVDTRDTKPDRWLWDDGKRDPAYYVPLDELRPWPVP